VNRAALVRQVEECVDESALFLEPRATYDKGIVGVGQHGPKSVVVVYDVKQLILALVEADGMTEEDACEFINFNTIGGWMGEGTPIFINTDFPND
jgi:hypothetical protein